MTLRHFLIAMLVPLTWGFGFALAKSGLDYFPPLLLMSLRFILAALVMVWFVDIPRGYFGRIFVISMVAATLQYGLLFSGLTMMDATPAILLVQSEVVFGVVIAAVLLKEKPTIRQVFGIGVSLIGILTIVGAPSLDGQAIGISLVLSGCLCWAFGQVMVRRLQGALTGFQLTAWLGVMAGPQMMLATIMLDGNPVPLMVAAPLSAWATVVYLGLMMTVIGYSAWYYVLARYPVPMVMPLLLLLPVATILGAVNFLGERPDPLVLIGGGIVIAGVGSVIVDPKMIGKLFRRGNNPPL
ncbi:EamA family transporter [Alphaproteobacteria bacterium]|nr:EamA family transporter [Alphaproteobacteria bacterium]